MSMSLIKSLNGILYNMLATTQVGVLKFSQQTKSCNLWRQLLTTCFVLHVIEIYTSANKESSL